MKHKKLIIAAAAGATAAAAGGAYMMWENSALKTREFEYVSENVPAGFDGYRIALLADLHSRCFGRGNANLLAALRDTHPDMIALAGDMANAHPRASVDTAITFAEGAAAIAPTFYVAGNHEAAISKKEFSRMCNHLAMAGVVVLMDDSQKLERGGDTICIAGLCDQSFDKRSYGGNEQVSVDFRTMKLVRDESDFVVLLAHRPDFLDVYARYGVDLVLSGHTHGGQCRIPGGGAIYVPGQGFKPEFVDGEYSLGRTTMFVTRGLGASVIPVRLCCRPEIAVITLRHRA